MLVHDTCAVTKNFAIESNGGLYFKDYFEFEGTLDYILSNRSVAEVMGGNGRKYVEKNFSWNKIIDRYINFFETIEGESE